MSSSSHPIARPTVPPCSALNKTLNELNNYGRHDNPALVILVTDGRYTQGTHDPAPIADKLRAYGATVFAVGVDGLNGKQSQAFYNELLRITRSPFPSLQSGP